MAKLKTIELFCGTKSFSKVAEKLGHEVFTIDNDKQHNPSLLVDLMVFNMESIKDYDVVWMSPPCTTFSLASGNKHWTADKKPKTKDAKTGLLLLNKCYEIACYCILHNKIFFIENPNGRAVWFLPNEWLKRVWYCQYGDTRAKPTNIWTNLKGWNPKVCKNDNPNCNHIRAKRGSKTGTQGLKGSIERGVIPEKLFYEIFEVIQW
jgi:hypothetical protein